ncbi:thioredoxin domain-containing protein [Micromonospora sp. NPDC049559]|uniref:DsbA family protein n=1 Tax=Micromonospora sp. NPDC049559 TaxID=3155923 RepID=UPI003421A82D
MVRAQIARERRRRRTLWTSVVAVAVLVIAGLIGWGVYASQRSGDFTAPRNTTSDGNGVVVGTGPVTMDVYEDFICPVCNQFEQQSGATVDQLVAQGKVRVIFHPVAYLDRASTTRYSSRSSAASGCAADAGKYREYAKALFQHQPPEGSAGLPDDQLISIGAGVGLDQNSFGSCVRNGTFKSWTQHVTDEASKANITGTPTVLVAGKQVPSPTPDALTAAVAAAPK